MNNFSIYHPFRPPSHCPLRLGPWPLALGPWVLILGILLAEVRVQGSESKVQGSGGVIVTGEHYSFRTLSDMVATYNTVHHRHTSSSMNYLIQRDLGIQ
jgi:hypothetical protein